MDRALTGTQADYAAYAGVTKQAVGKWKSKGLLVFTDDGRVSFAESDARRAEQADPSHKGRGAQGQGSATQGFAHAKARHEHFRAMAAEVDYKRTIGELVDRTEVEDALREAGRAIRRELDGVMLMADELDAAARKGGVQAVRSVLRQRLRELENSTADRLERLRLDRAADDTEGLDLADDGDGDRTYG